MKHTKIVKVGVECEYNNVSDIWGYSIWADTTDGVRYKFREEQPTVNAALTLAEIFFGNHINEMWDEVPAVLLVGSYA